MYLEKVDFDQMPDRYKANFFNHLNGFKSANLIGTQNDKGQLNLAIFNSVVHLGANPPLMGFILRPTTVERHTFNNILKSRHFTINHIHSGIIEQAHQTSAKYASSISEFEACHLTPELDENIKAPFVKESFIKIALSFKSDYLIKENNTRLVVGEVISVRMNQNLINSDGSIDLEKAKSVAISGLDTYFSTNKLIKLSYARPTANLIK